jgi:hypothetical protein
MITGTLLSWCTIALLACAGTPADRVRDFVMSGMDNEGLIVANYARSFGGSEEHLVTGYDLGSRAWFKIYGGKVYGSNPRSGFFAGRELPGTVAPVTDKRRDDHLPPDRFFPFIYVLTLCERNGAIRDVVDLPGGGLLVRAAVPRGSLYLSEDESSQEANEYRVEIEIDGKGHVQTVRHQIDTMARRHSYEEGAPPGFPLVREVNPGNGDWRLVSFEHSPRSAESVFNMESVERRAIAARTGTRVSYLNKEPSGVHVIGIDERGFSTKGIPWIGAGLIALVLGVLLWWRRR